MYGRSLGKKVRIVFSNKQPNKKLPQVPSSTKKQKQNPQTPKLLKDVFHIKYLRQSLPSPPLDAQAAVLWGLVTVMKWRAGALTT